MLLVSSDSGNVATDGVWLVTEGGAKLAVAAAGLGALVSHPTLPLLYGVSRGADGDFLLVWSEFSLVATVALAGRGSCAIEIVGDHLAIAHYDSGEVSAVTLDTAGMPYEVRLVALAGSGPDSDRQEMSHPHHVVGLDGAALIVDLGDDRIWALDLPGLGLTSYAELPAGSGPRHAAITPSGLAVSGELDATVLLVSSNVLATPASTLTAAARTYPSDILWHPAGFVVMANRGVDSLSVFSPTLERVCEVPAAGAWPLNLTCFPNGSIAVANRDSDVVAVFTFSPMGQLNLQATHAIPRPTWVLSTTR